MEKKSNFVGNTGISEILELRNVFVECMNLEKNLASSFCRQIRRVIFKKHAVLEADSQIGYFFKLTLESVKSMKISCKNDARSSKTSRS